MYKIAHRDLSCILNILDSISKIEKYTKEFTNADDFYNNTQAFDATLMNFVIIGEMVEKLSDDFLEKTKKETDWYKVKGFRNIIAHNYFGVDAEEVWQIIRKGIPQLKINLELIIK